MVKVLGVICGGCRLLGFFMWLGTNRKKLNSLLHIIIKSVISQFIIVIKSIYYKLFINRKVWLYSEWMII